MVIFAIFLCIFSKKFAVLTSFAGISVKTHELLASVLFLTSLLLLASLLLLSPLLLLVGLQMSVLLAFLLLLASLQFLMFYEVHPKSN
jgi:hypothetical protein